MSKHADARRNRQEAKQIAERSTPRTGGRGSPRRSGCCRARARASSSTSSAWWPPDRRRRLRAHRRRQHRGGPAPCCSRW